jgi:DNA (cytosine-5)-methyltransferase 1
VAWHPLGWTAAAFAEIEAFPSAVFAQHYPSVSNYGDITRFADWPDAGFDVLVGGTPCQSFSVAGLRKGLADPRGNLALTYLAILDRYRPTWCCWENVPGVLSADGGRALGAFLGGLGQLGYGFCGRVLDAQYFGLAQRRKRLFVVGHLGDWRRAAAVLFERASLSGHPAPRRETRQDVAAGTLGAEMGRNRGLGNESEIGLIVPFDTTQITHPENRSNPQPGDPSPSLAKGGHPPAVAFADLADLVAANQGRTYTREGSNNFRLSNVAIGFRADAARDGEARTPSPDAEGRVRLRDAGFNVYTELAPTLDSSAPHGVGHRMQVRRLTPRECERLQGFPDDYTLIPYRGKPAADGPRYKALGNSMAVPVMNWIGKRIAMVEAAS